MGLFTNKFVADFEATLQQFVMQCTGITMQYDNETAAQAQARTQNQMVSKARAVKRAGKEQQVLPKLQQFNAKFGNDADWARVYAEVLQVLR